MRNLVYAPPPISRGGASLVSSPDPTPHEGKRGLGTLVEFVGILNVSSHVTITYSDPLAQRAGLPETLASRSHALSIPPRGERAWCIAYKPLVLRCRNSCITNQISEFRNVTCAAYASFDRAVAWVCAKWNNSSRAISELP